MKVVVNRCYGGFGVSKEATEYMAARGSERAKENLEMEKKTGRFYGYGLDDARTDPLLIEAVEKLGAKANGEYADLVVIEIPDGVDWDIDDYDGIETIHEKHRSW